MADRYPCGINTDTLTYDDWSFYLPKGVDAIEYVETTDYFVCGELSYDDEEVALCNRCAQALGVLW